MKNVKYCMINVEYIYCMVVLIFIVPSAYAISDDALSWSEGNNYRMAPTDNVITDREYTIKAVEFPPPIRGEMTIGRGVVPERPVIPFIKLELYKDIVNNANPISTFVLSEIGDRYITPDQELKITLDNIPTGMSQDWIYEYYNPWAVIKIQRRAVPNLDIGISLTDIDEDTIDPGESFRAEVKIKNTGEDAISNINFDINSDSLLMRSTSNKLKDSIYILNKDEEKIIEIVLTAPISIAEREYNIYVNATGYDIKDIIYLWNISKIIKVRGEIRSIYINKQVPRNTSYLKENVRVVLNVINGGSMNIDNVQINDSIPDKLLFINNNTAYSLAELSWNKTSLGPTSSWSIDYILKPTEPGVYLLPALKANFSIRGEKFSMTTGEVGFRVFGPKVVLTKSAINRGNDVIEVKVAIKNIGNGFASRVTIEDQLPDNASLTSGEINWSTSLDEGTEKTMSYTIKIPSIKNIGSISWPPARAIYYLDEYKFNTSSNEKIIEEMPKDIISPEIVAKQTVEIPVPQITQEETQKRVVATIPAKIPVETPTKESPGFMIYESLLSIILVMVLCFLRGRKK